MDEKPPAQLLVFDAVTNQARVALGNLAVRYIVDHISDDYSASELLELHPSLTTAEIDACFAYLRDKARGLPWRLKVINASPAQISQATADTAAEIVSGVPLDLLRCVADIWHVLQENAGIAAASRVKEREITRLRDVFNVTCNNLHEAICNEHIRAIDNTMIAVNEEQANAVEESTGGYE